MLKLSRISRIFQNGRRVAANNNVKMNLSSVSGEHGNALRVEYDMTADTLPYTWLNLTEPSSMDINKPGRISFWLRCEGSPNNLEFKASDIDGGDFVRICFGGTKTSGWRKITIDTGEFTYGWGRDKQDARAAFQAKPRHSKILSHEKRREGVDRDRRYRTVRP